MKKLYNDARLVHADLSEYNLLWHNDMVYMIDVAQAVDAMHPYATKFLLRDCNSISVVGGAQRCALMINVTCGR